MDSMSLAVAVISQLMGQCHENLVSFLRPKNVFVKQKPKPETTKCTKTVDECL